VPAPRNRLGSVTRAWVSLDSGDALTKRSALEDMMDESKLAGQADSVPFLA